MRIQGLSLVLSCCLLMMSALPQSCAAQELESATVTRVKDGDTFVAIIRGTEETIRLIGIDAPESYRNNKFRYDAGRSGESDETLIAKGQAATAFLKVLLPEGTSVRLEFDRRIRDRYKRLLCYVYLPDGTMVNELLVEQGHAIVKAYTPNIRYHERLKAAEANARRRGTSGNHGAD